MQRLLDVQRLLANRYQGLGILGCHMNRQNITGYNSWYNDTVSHRMSVDDNPGNYYRSVSIRATI